MKKQKQSIRQLWKHYYTNTDGIIFVIDSNDTKRVSGDDSSGVFFVIVVGKGRGRIKITKCVHVGFVFLIVTAKEELHRLMSEAQLANTVLLVLANKQDLPHAVKPTELEEHLDLKSIKQSHHIQGTDWIGYPHNLKSDKREAEGEGKKKNKETEQIYEKKGFNYFPFSAVLCVVPVCFLKLENLVGFPF
ncbi:ADP-ribosylation factor arf [Reticulomyxa filosa]|uniref:ADP-ribosylation factor arf n=1 Tax=Reticulomyxa filosa TaxID=46433 RepID=X6P7N3_RETFI|nr:ADP-ribosylation factor arf [Reticulomyxa filosa]|eukprot:ETO34128.1 ADP-ribosylation factor arf [Reticulomyxa filosa]